MAFNGVGNGFISPGGRQQWIFTFGGNGDQGAQYFMAHPLNPESSLEIEENGKVLRAGGFFQYHAIVRCDGPLSTNFNWSGGGLT